MLRRALDHRVNGALKLLLSVQNSSVSLRFGAFTMSHPDPDIIAAIQQQTMTFTDDPIYAARFCDAMGRMLLLWGRIEKSLDDLLISGIVISRDSDESHDVYISLKRKLNLLANIFHNSTHLRPLHSRAVALAEDIRNNSKDRNRIIHASWIGFEDGIPAKLKMQHLKHEPGHVTVSDFTVTIEMLSQLGSNFHLCNSKILALQIDTLEILKKARQLAELPASSE